LLAAQEFQGLFQAALADVAPGTDHVREDLDGQLHEEHIPALRVGSTLDQCVSS
jgi:hypothetical protein